MGCEGITCLRPIMDLAVLLTEVGAH
jgi:hypothetical protein